MSPLNQAATLSCAYKTDTGRRRNVNEDSFAVIIPPDCGPRVSAILIVSDGMGGAGGGDVASSITVQLITSTILCALSETGTPVESAMQKAFSAANDAVRRRRLAGGRLADMGATAVCAVVCGDQVTLANIGDSRCYLMRDGALTLLTADHSMVWEEVQQGRLTPKEAERSQFRNVITRAIGIAEEAVPDLSTLTLLRGDRLMLCSDGLSTELADEDIAATICREHSTERAAEALVSAVLRSDAKDNVTVVLADFMPPSGEGIGIATNQPGGIRTVGDSGTKAEKNILRIVEHILLIVSTITACVFGYQLYGHHNLTKPIAPQVVNILPATVVPKPGEPIHLASTPILLAHGRFRPDVLAADSRTLFVASSSGALTGLDIATGKVLPPLPGFKLDAPAVPLPKTALPDVIFTSTGLRFQIASSSGTVQQFNGKGVLIATDIGKGYLNQPTRLAFVDHLGLIVLDHDRVWKFGIKNVPTTLKGSE